MKHTEPPKALDSDSHDFLSEVVFFLLVTASEAHYRIKMNTHAQNTLKYLIGLLVVIGLRLIPHPPNVEPIMSTMMPFSKKWGWLSGIAFCLTSVLGYDLITGTLGIWSLSTAGTYALLGAAAGWYFAHRKGSVIEYVGFSVVATIVYDAITGIGIGMIFFHQPFMTTFVGQIPFTLAHLMGNVILSAIVSPLLYRWVVANPRLETKYVWAYVEERLHS